MLPVFKPIAVNVTHKFSTLFKNIEKAVPSDDNDVTIGELGERTRDWSMSATTDRLFGPYARTSPCNKV